VLTDHFHQYVENENSVIDWGKNQTIDDVDGFGE